MDMSTEIPTWLTALSWTFVALAVACAALIAYDIYGRGYRQPTGAMDVVWPITALYLGPLAVFAYYRWARPRTSTWRHENDGATEKGLTAAAVTGGIPGGAASAVGHVIGVPLVVFSGLTFLGLDLWAMILTIAIIAAVLLFAFEYLFVTVPARGLKPGEGVGVALTIALVTVLAFDIGMGGWMVVLHLFLGMPPLTDVSFFFLMQVGLVLGFLTGYPAVRLLEQRGIKITA